MCCFGRVPSLGGAVPGPTASTCVLRFLVPYIDCAVPPLTASISVLLVRAPPLAARSRPQPFPQGGRWVKVPSMTGPVPDPFCSISGPLGQGPLHDRPGPAPIRFNKEGRWVKVPSMTGRVPDPSGSIRGALGQGPLFDLPGPGPIRSNKGAAVSRSPL